MNEEPLDLSELLLADALKSAEAVHVPDPQRRVEHAVLAETFERLRQMSPHSLVVLHDEAATGGWSLAAALHVAWERNAAAVVVPRPAMSASSAVLAERLSIALLVIDDDPVDLALALAGQISAPRAARAVRVARCAERLAEQPNIRGVLQVLNGELAPVPVALAIGSTVAAGRATALRHMSGCEQVRVDINGTGGQAWAELVASVPKKGATTTDHVAAMLRLARLPLQAAWAQSRMHTSSQEVQERAAFQMIRRLASEEKPSDPAQQVEPDAEVAVPAWISELGWRLEGVNRAIWISPVRDTGVEPTHELTQLVRATWQRYHPDWPVIADSDGWISWQNSPDGDDLAAIRRSIGIVTPAARSHALVLGVGGAHRGIPGLLRSITEARLAAYVARDSGPGSVRWFAQVGARAALAWLPRGQIAEVADLCLADLMAARDRGTIVDTVLAVLDSGGSLSKAAARLGVHRNTVLSRVARAKELGLAFDDPAHRLALHVLCYSLASLSPETGIVDE
jgi:hypothetical protein